MTGAVEFPLNSPPLHKKNGLQERDHLIRYTSSFVNTVRKSITPSSLLNPVPYSVQLVALTNTNELHCKVWPRKYSETIKLFNKLFISSELGVRKPEERAFMHVLEYCGVDPQGSLFFDDRIENVSKAIELGIHGVQVSNPSDITDELQRQGLITNGLN